MAYYTQKVADSISATEMLHSLVITYILYECFANILSYEDMSIQ